MDGTIFLTWTEEELLAALKKASREAAEGKTIISAGAGDVNGSKHVFYSPTERALALMWALGQINPEGYPEYAAAGSSATIGRF